MDRRGEGRIRGKATEGLSATDCGGAHFLKAAGMNGDVRNTHTDFGQMTRSALFPNFLNQPNDRSLNRRLETAATCFDCCLSQKILDGGNGLLTT
jgi:hypothetical protein